MKINLLLKQCPLLQFYYWYCEGSKEIEKKFKIRAHQFWRFAPACKRKTSHDEHFIQSQHVSLQTHGFRIETLGFRIETLGFVQGKGLSFVDFCGTRTLQIWSFFFFLSFSFFFFFRILTTERFQERFFKFSFWIHTRPQCSPRTTEVEDRQQHRRQSRQGVRRVGCVQDAPRRR